MTSAETDAIAALGRHITTASTAELMELARTCPDRRVRAAADRVAVATERLRTRLRTAVAEAYRAAHDDQDVTPAPDEAEETPAAPDPAPAPAPASEAAEIASEGSEVAPGPLAGRRRAGRRSSAAAPRTPHRTAPPRRPAKGNGSGVSLDQSSVFTFLVEAPTAEEAAAVRRLCERYGRTPAEAADLVAMLGVGVEQAEAVA